MVTAFQHGPSRYVTEIMGFRRDGKKIHGDAERWKAWCSENRALVVESGLPTDVTASEEDWWYFVDHAYNRTYHTDNLLFQASDLSEEQASVLWRLIKSSVEQLVPDHDVKYPSWMKSLENTYKPKMNRT